MKTLRTPAELIGARLVAPERRSELDAVAARYAVAITPEMAALIDPADPDDPIARQFIPDARELERRPDENEDPIGDAAHSPVEGIVHRYPDRVLLKPLHACAVYCRFCFRREMVGPKGLGTLSSDALAAALAYIASRPEIWEVIVTGGDPLILSPRRLSDSRPPARRDRPCEGDPLPHARAAGRSGADHAGARPRAEGQGQGDVRGAARQPRCASSRPRLAPQSPGSLMPAFRFSARPCCCAASTTTRRRSRR